MSGFALHGALAVRPLVIPVSPWSGVIRNPRIWHFSFHTVPNLPEVLVSGHEQIYFDCFFDAISANPAVISTDSKRCYAQAYATPRSLKSGFDWYRAFPRDEKDNSSMAGTRVSTAVLYVRGDAKSGDLQACLNDLGSAGLTNLRGALIPSCGHFSLDEQPAAVADVLRLFLSE